MASKNKRVSEHRKKAKQRHEIKRRKKRALKKQLSREEWDNRKNGVAIKVATKVKRSRLRKQLKEQMWKEQIGEVEQETGFTSIPKQF